VRVPLHIVEDRRRKLANLLEEQAYMPVQDICMRLGISTATARRDLSALAGSGQLVRTLGGALAERDATFSSFAEKLRKAQSGKRAIGKRAAAIVPVGCTLFLDGGTTLLAVADAIARKNPGRLTIVTNNLPAADRLASVSRFEVIVPGGRYIPQLAQLGGPKALRGIERIQFDLALMGGEAMRKDGIYTSHPDIARLQAAVLARSRQRAFCLDRSKLGARAHALIVNWPDVRRLFTDASEASLAETAPAALEFLG
jgi:DeoR/GlpR family transcriptional regulator of sugar metabolism